MVMPIRIEYGDDLIELDSIHAIVAKGMQEPPPPVKLPEAIQESLAHPIHAPSLLEVAECKIANNAQSRAVIVVSDNTRPVPYYGRKGIVFQIIRVLQQAGFDEDQIVILIGAGSHRNMEPPEIEAMIGLQQMGLHRISVINHEYDRIEALVSLGHTPLGSHVQINRRYFEADLKNCDRLGRKPFYGRCFRRPQGNLPSHRRQGNPNPFSRRPVSLFGASRGFNPGGESTT